ncbi:hypothetical protein [Bacteroides rodentium]
MRTSSYNIIVKVDDDAGRYALLNSYTHAFDIVNQNVYRYLKNEGSDCDISDETKKKLVKRGYITSLSKEDERELVKRLLDKIYDEVRLKNFGFHFIISYDCNLRCDRECDAECVGHCEWFGCFYDHPGGWLDPCGEFDNCVTMGDRT